MRFNKAWQHRFADQANHLGLICYERLNVCIRSCSHDPTAPDCQCGHDALLRIECDNFAAEQHKVGWFHGTVIANCEAAIWRVTAPLTRPSATLSPRSEGRGQ